jgi:urease
MFVSQAAASEKGAVRNYGLRKQIEVVKNCRTVKKQHMKFNNAMPKINIDPETLVCIAFIKHSWITLLYS